MWLHEEYERACGERLDLRTLSGLTQEEAVVIIEEMVRSEREKRARGG